MEAINEHELNKNLAEWAGFKEYAPEWEKYAGMYFEWLYPDDSSCMSLPNFTQSLDVCFKWLIPKLEQTHSWNLTCDDERAWYYFSIIFVPSSDAPVTEYIAYEGTPALTLCLAINKMIEQRRIKGIGLPNKV